MQTYKNSLDIKLKAHENDKDMSIDKNYESDFKPNERMRIPKNFNGVMILGTNIMSLKLRRDLNFS